MTYPFAIEPATFQAFENEEDQLKQCKAWGLLTEKATKTKEFSYKGHNVQLSCSIVGLVDPITAVISFDNQQLHCIHPAYLKEMQAASFSQKQSTALEAATLDGNTTNDGAAPLDGSDADSTATLAKTSGPAASKSRTPEEQKPKPAKAASTTKSKKLALPAEKVKMTAVVKEFATVPNHFTEEDDEVVVYDEVMLVDSKTEVGLAWSSHSATLKKLELAIGEKLSFEAKIIAKKLTRHPVPYKINNPSKILKVTD